MTPCVTTRSGLAFAKVWCSGILVPNTFEVSAETPGREYLGGEWARRSDASFLEIPRSAGENSWIDVNGQAGPAVAIGTPTARSRGPEPHRAQTRESRN